MNTQKKEGRMAPIEILNTEANYNRKTKWLRSLERIKVLLLSCLKSTIIWFPTHGLMSIAVGDWLIQALRLRTA